jgi:4-amino-4-deoxy-L-arabinose transferase-like glycosyltransferase
MDLSRPSTRRTLLLAVLLLAALLRFPDLGSKSIWGDEATSIFVSLGVTTANDHPPGYYFLSGLAVKLFGLGEFQVRFFSALCGLLLVWGLYLLGDRLCRLWKFFPSNLGLTAALMAALSPYFIQLSQEGRPYSELAAVAAWSTYFFLVVLEKKKILGEGGTGDPLSSVLPAMGYILVTALGLYTHYFAWFIIALQGLLWIYLFIRHPHRRSDLAKVLLLPALVFVLFLPILPRIVTLVSARSEGIEASRGVLSLKYYASRPVASAFHFATGYYFTGNESFRSLGANPLHALTLALFALLPLLLFLSGVVAMFRQGKRHAAWEPALIFLLGLLFSLLGAMTIDTSIARQHSISAVFFFIIIALGWAALPRLWRYVAAAGYGVVLLLSLISYYGQQTHPFYKTDWRSATAYVRQHYRPGDLLYVSFAEREGYYSLKAYGYDQEIVYAKRPSMPEPQSTWINPQTRRRFRDEEILDRLLERSPRLYFVHPPITLSEELQRGANLVISDRRSFGRDLEVCTVTRPQNNSP